MGRREGLRGEGAERPSQGVLAADRKTRGSRREGVADTAGRAGGQVWWEELAQTQGADRRRHTHTHTGTDSRGGTRGRRAAASAHLAAAAAEAPAAGLLSPRSGPPSRRAGGRPAGRRRPHGGGGGGGGGAGGGGGDAGAADYWAAGTQLHQPTPGRSARLGRTRRRSVPLGSARLGWGRGPRPPAQVASGARGGGAFVRAQAP